MKSRITWSAAILALAALSARAHKLDEYLQGTIIAVEKDRLQVQMTLTPGVAVFARLIADIDTDSDGVISKTEERAYASQVLHDLSLSIDGHLLTPQLLSITFPSTDEMKEGRGEILLDFSAVLPGGGRSRKLVLENRHESRISAYQVNCLVPRDPHIRIAAQVRNYSQSLYRLEYIQTDVASNSAWLRVCRVIGWLSPMALFLFIWVMLRQKRGGASSWPDPSLCRAKLAPYRN